MNLAVYIDHTLLKPDATPIQIEKLCNEAKTHGFAAVCVNPLYVELAANQLKGSKVLVATTVGFPLGANTVSIKAREAWEAINQGAGEIDMVMSIGTLKSGDNRAVENEIREVVKACENIPVKVILETCLLNQDEIIKACNISVEAGAAYVKTSTGFSTGGATVEVVRLMKKTVGDRCKVKASGGIRTKASALEMIDAGASRIGTSNGVEIVK